PAVLGEHVPVIGARRIKGAEPVFVKPTLCAKPNARVHARVCVAREFIPSFDNCRGACTQNRYGESFSRGTGDTVATCRGGARARHIASWSRKSCSSKRRSSAS